MYIYPCFLIPMLFLFLLAATNYLPHILMYPYVIRGHVATHTPTPFNPNLISYLSLKKNPLPLKSFLTNCELQCLAVPQLE